MIRWVVVCILIEYIWLQHWNRINKQHTNHMFCCSSNKKMKQPQLQLGSKHSFTKTKVLKCGKHKKQDIIGKC